MTIGQAGKHYLVQITSMTLERDSRNSVNYDRTPVCYGGGESVVLLPGGSSLTSNRDFIAVWQEIDGYTNH